MAQGAGWPLRRYLVGLVVLFVVAAAAAMGYGWSAAGRDARSAALQDAAFGGRLAAGFVNLAVLGGVLADLYSGPWHLSYLLTTADGGTVLTRSIDPARWIGTRTADTPFGAGGAGERPDVAGRVRLFQRIDVPGQGWHLYAGADRGAALAAAQRVALRQLLITGAGLLVALVAAL